MRAFLIWLGWVALGGIIVVCAYVGFCLYELCNDLENTEPWWEKLLNESIDL